MLAHPFLTGKPVTRMIGEEAEYDVFLSYRVSSEAWLAELVYEHLTSACKLRVWWDRRCLEPGVPWDEGFCQGLIKSRAFLPLLSRGAYGPFERLAAGSPCDNVLLEHRLALELHERGLCERIFPVFLGDLDEASGRYGRYLFAGPGACHPLAAPEAAVDAVESRLAAHLEKEGLGMPLHEGTGVAEVVKGVCRFQGVLLEGAVEDLRDGMAASLSPVTEFLRRPEPARRQRSKKNIPV